MLLERRLRKCCNKFRSFVLTITFSVLQIEYNMSISYGQTVNSSTKIEILEIKKNLEIHTLNYEHVRISDLSITFRTL